MKEHLLSTSEMRLSIRNEKVSSVCWFACGVRFMHSPRAAAVDENQERESVSGMLASLFGGFGSAFPTANKKVKSVDEIYQEKAQSSIDLLDQDDEVLADKILLERKGQ